jgi:hypothetical protein
MPLLFGLFHGRRATEHFGVQWASALARPQAPRSALHDMHGRWRRLGRDWLDVPRWERRGWLRPEPLGPDLRADAPGRRMRPTFHRPQSVAPDMDDLDHSALPDPGTASPWRAEDVTLFSVRGLGPPPLSGGENAICFGHELPRLWVLVAGTRSLRRLALRASAPKGLVSNSASSSANAVRSCGFGSTARMQRHNLHLGSAERLVQPCQLVRPR